MNPTSLIAQTFELTANHNCTVVDQYNTPTGRTVSINPDNTTRYFRFCAAANGNDTASGATSEESAAEMLDHVKRRLNAGTGGTPWLVSINSSGFVRITYVGTGSASITWTSTTLRDGLGFTGNLTFSSGQTQTAAYQPSHCYFLVGRETQSPYRANRHMVAAVKTRAGRVSALKSGSRPTETRFVSVLHPTSYAYQSSLAIYSTPIEPSSAYETVTDTFGAAQPWSMMHLAGCWDHACGLLLGTFQAEVSSTATTYDLAYLDPESSEENELLEANFLGTQKIKELVFSVKTKGASL